MKVGDQTFQVTSDDQYLDRMNGVFQPSTAALFKALVKPGDVVLDIGANGGCTTLLAAQTATKVTAFEPGSRTHALLTKNGAQSGLDNAQAVNLGLGPKDAEHDLVFNPADRSGGFVSVGNSEKGQVGLDTERIRIMRRNDSIIAALEAARLEDFLQICVRRSARFIRPEQRHKTDTRAITGLRETGHALRALNDEVATLRAEGHALRKTASWKVTAPLRALRRLL